MTTSHVCANNNNADLIFSGGLSGGNNAANNFVFGGTREQLPKRDNTLAAEVEHRPDNESRAAVAGEEE